MTTMQLNQISQFIRESGIQYYDLEMEVADHISEWIVRDMELHNCSFDASFSRLPEYFSSCELSTIQKSRKKYLSDKYYTIFLNEFLKFFTWPKIILQVLFIILAVVFFSIAKEKEWIGYYLFQIQFFILIGAGFTYRFKEMYKLQHETDMIQKLLPHDTVVRVGTILRLPIFLSYILATIFHTITGELPIIIYQLLVYSYAIQMPYSWAVSKIEADARLSLRKEYPEAFQCA